ncbi:hypothetical protein J5X84_18860 [Streptosporangiaceae bacterium NEAU-GS5]|nr:hypothetical protein [Streptosporangiaceae bacterium NEAU-GS5]
MSEIFEWAATVRLQPEPISVETWNRLPEHGADIRPEDGPIRISLDWSQL